MDLYPFKRNFNVDIYEAGQTCQPVVTNNCVYCFDQRDFRDGSCIDGMSGDPASTGVHLRCQESTLHRDMSDIDSVELDIGSAPLSREPVAKPFQFCRHYGAVSAMMSSQSSDDSVTTLQFGPDDYRALYTSRCPIWKNCTQCLINSHKCEDCTWCELTGNSLMYGILLLSDLWNWQLSDSSNDSDFYHLGDLMVALTLKHYDEVIKSRRWSHDQVLSTLEGFEDSEFYFVKASKIFGDERYCTKSSTYCGSAVELIPQSLRPRNYLTCSQLYLLSKHINLMISDATRKVSNEGTDGKFYLDDMSKGLRFEDAVHDLRSLESLGFCREAIPSTDYFDMSCFGNTLVTWSDSTIETIIGLTDRSIATVCEDEYQDDALAIYTCERELHALKARESMDSVFSDTGTLCASESIRATFSEIIGLLQSTIDIADNYSPWQGLAQQYFLQASIPGMISAVFMLLWLIKWLTGEFKRQLGTSRA